MSDYLTNLAARTMGLASVVQPRRPLLFEPSAATAAGDAEPPPEQVPPRDSDPTSPRQPTQQPEYRGPQPVAGVAASVPTTTPTEEHAGQSPEGRTAVAFRPAAHQVRNQERSSAGKPQAGDRPPTIDEPQRPSAPTLPSHFDQPEEAAPASLEATPPDQPIRPATRNDAATPTVPQPRQQLPADSGERREPSEAIGDDSGFNPLPQSPVLGPPDSVLPLSPESVPRPSAGEQPAPKIQVTIGRIDVRAVTAPPPPSKPRPKKNAPQLGLSDYLAQRTNGRRK